MSDLDRPALTTAAPMYVHYCEQEGCGEWGGWGNSPSPAVATRWWCFGHFPHWSHEQELARGRKPKAAERGDNAE
ncbi:hypothetical protein CO657_30415 (plasmid) [Rhizobium acidisoli]|uniref:Uncharacterized protein n=1 Tax=Rhizobium acidisoli TaxID=1538158 RepID=A0AAE5WTF1_9HYPH|nr:hypothetical protein CO657_30415 [Rhizobium acidisoli]